MPATRKRQRKNGSVYYEISVSRGYGKSAYTMRWDVPEGLSAKTIKARLQQAAYLLTAISRKKADYLRKRAQRERIELPADIDHTAFDKRALEMELSELWPSGCENEVLNATLMSLVERDRYIFTAHALYQRDFEELSAELDLGYQGVAAVYYRVRKKIRKALEGNK